ncbi:hypothetical protein [Bacillus suaedaesalsae]|uniref:Uncharacterized protein n=1 Tax=Bacillus suaedaesalsae TaxID=2810349 RepID=A0ABS2DK70_9BACI|nr:hypothetical protein [Bacillus suaedaesalsae]MBM6618420.1 hypothetical protein [Bacillus suaedaesalsae]
MFGTLVLNFIFAMIGFIVVFFSAFANNGFLTSLIRGLIAYVSFFLIAYIFRWMIHFIISNPKGNTKPNINQSNPKDSVDAEQLRHSMDHLTDEDAEAVSHYIKDLLKEQD